MVFSAHFQLIDEKETDVLQDLHKGLIRALQDPNQNSQESRQEEEVSQNISGDSGPDRSGLELNMGTSKDVRSSSESENGTPSPAMIDRSCTKMLVDIHPT